MMSCKSSGFHGFSFKDPCFQKIITVNLSKLLRQILMSIITIMVNEKHCH